MNMQALTTAMTVSISDVLETMFFLPLDVVSDVDTPDAEKTERISVSVAFNGPAVGAFFLQVPLVLAREVSADFMGVDPEGVTRNTMNETVKEMINMLAGNCLSAYDADLVFDLEVPETIGNEALHPPVADNASEVWLKIQTMASHLTMGVCVTR